MPNPDRQVSESSRTRGAAREEAAGAAPALSACLARLGVIDPAEIPEPVMERARLHAMDALGLALASHGQAYREPTLAAVTEMASPGEASVIGLNRRFAPRDAALINGVLIHGLDYDDTHLASIVHPTAASLPACLAVGEHLGASWIEVLAAYAIGAEVSIRLGAAIDGGLHHVGFHATGVLSHFGSAMSAGRLLGLSDVQLQAAQGIAASTASGVQVFLETGAWTKRLHPGWGAVAGITAAYLARNGFVAPPRPYDGRFGLFEAFLHGHPVKTDALLDGLGRQWRFAETAIKPYPACHFVHGCIDAAIELHAELGADVADVTQVTAWLPAPTMPIVAEPIESKRNARTDYEGKFSAPYCVATALLKGRFGLAELESPALADPRTRALAQRVSCSVDPDSRFPICFSGGVSVRLADGRTLQRHVPVNKGAGDRSLTPDDLVAKFLDTAGPYLGTSRARQVADLLLDASPRPVRDVMQALVPAS